jgi:TolB protein
MWSKSLFLAFLVLFAVNRVHAQPRQQETPIMPSTPILAVIEADGNLAIYDSKGKNPFRLTTDARPGQRIYQWPTWSTDGRLAFFGANADPADPYTLRAFVAEKVHPNAPIQIAYSSKNEVFTYPYWSTGDDCGAGCRTLALLFTPVQHQGLGLRLIQDRAGVFTNQVVGYAAPYYYSFSADGKQMIWVRYTQQIDLYNVASNQTTALPDEPGHFNSPMWSPLPNDNRILFGVPSKNNPELTDVVIADGASRRVILPNQQSPVSFAWSPDARYIASVQNFDRIIITEVATGKQVAQGLPINVAAYFWSPTSDKVAYVVVNRSDAPPAARIHVNGKTAAEQATGGLTLAVIDVQTGNSESLATFSPTRDYVYMLNFFDQFAHSHRFWSPDGTQITYAALDSKDQPTIYLVDITGKDAPVKVTNGTISVWSWK